ncbi:MAG: acylphosphatase [Pseudomonadota bacterium]
METLHSIITGQSQDEYFLAWIEEQATALNLTGWARHLSDTEVEIIAQGDQDDARALLEKLMSGSVMTGANSVTEDWLENYSPHDIFEIR